MPETRIRTSALNAAGPNDGSALAARKRSRGFRRGPPGNTTTRLPDLDVREQGRKRRAFSIPMPPEETNLQIVDGWLVLDTGHCVVEYTGSGAERVTVSAPP